GRAGVGAEVGDAHGVAAGLDADDGGEGGLVRGAEQGGVAGGTLEVERPRGGEALAADEGRVREAADPGAAVAPGEGDGGAGDGEVDGALAAGIHRALDLAEIEGLAVLGDVGGGGGGGEGEHRQDAGVVGGEGVHRGQVGGVDARHVLLHPHHGPVVPE